MENWQYQLAEAKHKGEDEIPVNEPLWATQLPLVDRIRSQTDHLLQQLPLMRTVSNTYAREKYRDEVAKSLIQLTYMQARVLQLTPNLSTRDRQTQMDTLFQNCSERIVTITNWLNL